MTDSPPELENPVLIESGVRSRSLEINRQAPAVLRSCQFLSRVALLTLCCLSPLLSPSQGLVIAQQADSAESLEDSRIAELRILGLDRPPTARPSRTTPTSPPCFSAPASRTARRTPEPTSGTSPPRSPKSSAAPTPTARPDSPSRTCSTPRTDDGRHMQVAT